MCKDNSRIIVKSILALLIILTPITGLQAAELDFTPLVAGYEQGCNISGTAVERFVIWTNPDEKGHIASTDSLPSLWKGHVGAPSITDNGNHWYVKVPLNEVRFHGLRVTSFERWYGKGCGINGWALVFDVPLNKARQSINEKKFQLDEDGYFKPELVADKNGHGTKLVCDVSM